MISIHPSTKEAGTLVAHHAKTAWGSKSDLCFTKDLDGLPEIGAVNEKRLCSLNSFAHG